MKVHKITDEESKVVTEFIHACENMLEKGKFSLRSPYEEWESWDDDDEEKKRIEAIKKGIMRNEDMTEVDGRIIAYEYLRRKYTHRLSLLNLTASVLLDNCCDPMADTLEFHPSFHFNHVAPEQ